MKLFKLFNVPVLLLIAASLLILRYGFFERISDIYLALTNAQYLLLIVAAVCIAAGGFLIEGISGAKKDFYGISEQKGINIYMLLTIAGVGLGFYLANRIGNPYFSGLFIVVAGGLYLYGTSLRHSLVVSNVATALIIAVAFITPFVFNLYPVNPLGQVAALPALFKQGIDFGILMFLGGLLHSIIKDLRDSDTDYNMGYNTMPVALGRARAAKVAFFTAIALAGALVYFFNKYLIGNFTALGICLVTVLGPLLFVITKIWTASVQKDFILLERAMKIVLFFTSIAVATTTIKL